MTTPLRVPVADQAGTTVWAADLAVAGQRPQGLTCVGCGGALVLRAGERNRPHFAHHHADSCTAGETALHRATCRVLAAALTTAADAGRRYPIVAGCRRCRADRVGNLAPAGLEVILDRELDRRIRPDVAAYVDGTVRYVIEVVVTHPPDPGALDLYRDLDLPVVLVRPTWEMLEQLRDGLKASLAQVRVGQPGRYEIVSRCRLPRHVDPGSVGCPTCHKPARRLTAEVSSLPCWRDGATVQVLDLYDRTDPAVRLITASCPDLPDPTELAAELGVCLEWRNSRTAGRSYRMHLCPRCRVSQGDNFVYSSSGPVPNLDVPVVHVTACSSGHLCQIDTRAWSSRSQARRDLTSGVVGLAGEPPGLFDDPALVRVRTPDGISVNQAIRRMVGGGWR